MGLTELGRLMAIVLGEWFAAIVGITVLKAFGGEIVTAGLLSAESGRGATISRMQLLLATVAVAIGYAGAALTRSPGDGLPDVPMAVVVALLGSHGVYLGAKGLRSDGGERR